MAKLKLTSCDEWFSKYIRLRDADGNGEIRCCSCGKPVFWKESDAGHFIPRKHRKTRYHEKNVWAQCRACNRFDDGNPAGYAKFLVEKFGLQILDDLLKVSRGSTRWTQFEINNMRDKFKQRAKDLANQKGLIL